MAEKQVGVSMCSFTKLIQKYTLSLMSALP